MLPDWVSNPGPLTYESGALPIALRGPATASWQIKTGSLGHFLEKPCVHPGGHSFDSVFMKLFQNIYHFEIKTKFETGL